MTTIILVLLAAVGGFVAGILVGRKNKGRVEKVVNAAETIETIFKK